MRVNLVLKSKLDAMLLAHLLEVEARSIDLRIDATGPRSLFYSSARTLLGVMGQPVALVINAETADPDSIAEQRQTAEEVIGHTAGRAPFCLLMAEPSLQSLFFTRAALISRAFGEGADDGGHVLELGRLSAQYAYKRLDPGGSEEATFLKLLQALDDDDVAALREESPVRELIAFVNEVGSPAAATSMP